MLKSPATAHSKHVQNPRVQQSGADIICCYNFYIAMNKKRLAVTAPVLSGVWEAAEVQEQLCGAEGMLLWGLGS